MHICIVGGGTAGWLAALMLSKERPQNTYTVIESSKIGIVGVGEAATGLFKVLMNDDLYGIEEKEFMKQTDALPKLAIRLKNWTGDGSVFDASNEGSFTTKLDSVVDSTIFYTVANDLSVDDCAISTILTSKNKTNAFILNDNLMFYQPSLNGYHFDAYKVGKYFSTLCDDVTYIDSKVINVNTSDNHISSLDLENGQTVEADMFIDCSGFGRVLSKALNINTVSYRDILPVDTAYLFKIKGDTRTRLPVSTATAMNNGWVFEIPTRVRIGSGYVYSSTHTNEEEVHKELEQYFGSEIEKVKNLPFENSRLENSLYGNCLSLGLSSCFLEPLQATSIHNTIVQIKNFINLVLTDDPKTTFNDTTSKLYNNLINRLYDDDAAFLALHYEGGREDTPFWKYVKYEKKKGDKLNHVLKLNSVRGLRQQDFGDYFGGVGIPLWNSVMCGLGLIDKNIAEQQLKLYNIDTKQLGDSIVNTKQMINADMELLKLMTQDELNDYLLKEMK